MIQALDTTIVCNTLDSFIPKLLERNRNRIRMEVIGYDQDDRELYVIKEVRMYFQKLFDEVDGAFYWIDPTSYMMIFWGLMLLPPYRINGQVGLTPEDMQKYLTWGFIKLNQFCEENSISPEPTNKKIFAAIKG